MTTINQFIEDLKRISDNKRDLPLVIYARNGLEVEPKIKMQFKEGTIFTESAEIERMVITHD